MEFMSELFCLFKGYADATNLESIAFLAAMTMPHLLLQRSAEKSI